MLISDIVPYVAPQVIGCPFVVIETDIRLAIIDLCKRGKAWHSIEDCGQLADQVRDYAVDPPNQAALETIEKVWVGGVRLTPASTSALGDVAGWDTATGSTPVHYNAEPDDGFVYLYPLPVDPPALEVKVQATYAPTLTATAIPDRLAQKWIEAIKHGALSRLLDMPNQTWTDQLLAEKRRAQFEIEVGKARIEFEYSGVAGSLRARPVRFG